MNVRHVGECTQCKVQNTNTGLLLQGTYVELTNSLSRTGLHATCYRLMISD